MNERLPNGWRSTTVGRLLSVLPKATQDKIIQVLREVRRCGLQTEHTNQLKELLRPHDAELEKEGALPDFLAYALAATVAHS